MTPVPISCPLCQCNVLVPTKFVPTAPLREYWSKAGYELSAHHAGYPDVFAVYTCIQCGLGTFAPQALGGPALYERLGAKEFYYPTTRWDHQSALTFLHKRGVRSVFEFGCGSGHFLEFVSRISAAAVGVDFNRDGVKQAQARGLDARFEWDYASGRTFEAVVTFQTLEHLEAPGAVVRQLVDLVAPEGYLIVAVPNEDGPLGDLSVNPLNAPPHHATLWPRSALEYIAVSHGLSLEYYAKEPINRTLYFTLIAESFQASLSGGGLLSRIVRKVLGWKIYAEAAVAFAEKRVALDGHNHIAIYRKRTAQA